MNISDSSFRIQSFCISDKGRRPNNEDFVAFFEPSDPQERKVSGCIYIVADGVGGAERGERASKYATEKVLYEYLKNPEIEPGQRLKQIIAQVNQDIFKYAEDNGIRMATTITVAVVFNNSLIVANVGDSRVYLVRGNEARQITEDHSLLGELVRHGEMTESEAMKSKIKNRITRSVGGNEEVKTDIFGPFLLKPNDKILLCSDGLTRYAMKKDIAICAISESPIQITNDLVDFAKRLGHGGADNISVITVIYEPTVDFEETMQTSNPRNVQINNIGGFCPNHGPYDGVTCPFPPPHGDKEQPEKPLLSDDGDTTKFGYGRGRRGQNDNGEEPTDIPNGNRNILDDDEETTDYGSAGHDDLDVTELEAPSTLTLATLWIKEGRRRGKTYNVYNGMVIGRKEGGIILDDPKVSSMHAKFKMEGDNLIVWDLGSSNGTYVNGRMIRGATLLDENDLVKIGDTVFVIKLLMGKKSGDKKTPKEINHTKPTKENQSIELSQDDISIKTPKENIYFRISVAYPLCLAKRYESVFLCHFFLPEYRAHVDRDIKSEFQDQKLGKLIDHSSSIQDGQKMKVKLSSPNFSFSDSGIKVIDNPVNKIIFLVMPNDSCEPGLHKILISVIDAETNREFESITINVQVVDFAFDHISRPLLSRVSTIVLGIGSFAMFMLTFLEQIDKTIGLTSGAAAGALALGIYASFYNLYQRVRPNTP